MSVTIISLQKLVAWYGVNIFVLCGHDMAVTEFYRYRSTILTPEPQLVVSCPNWSLILLESTPTKHLTLAPQCLSIHAQSISSITCGFMSHMFGTLHGMAYVIMSREIYKFI